MSKSALAFARERHAFASGDIQRGINQMKVIDAMLNKIKSPALLMGFSKIMDAASDCFVTDFSQDQISALVRMQLSDFANWDIQSYTVTGSSGTSTQCYSAKGQKLYVMKPDEASVSKAKEMIAVAAIFDIGTIQCVAVVGPCLRPKAGGIVQFQFLASDAAVGRQLCPVCDRHFQIVARIIAAPNRELFVPTITTCRSTHIDSCFFAGNIDLTISLSDNHLRASAVHGQLSTAGDVQCAVRMKQNSRSILVLNIQLTTSAVARSVLLPQKRLSLQCWD